MNNMKRATKTVEKRTYGMKGAIASFVTICKAGANFTPFSQLRYGESEKFGQEIEVSRIEFSKSDFTTLDLVEAYLRDNSFEDFSVNEDESVFYVNGIESDKFDDIEEIELETGVKYFIGKLKEPIDIDAPAAEVTHKAEFEADLVIEDNKDAQEEVKDESTEEIEVVQESAQEDKVEDEEAKPEGQEATGEEGSEPFTAEEEIKEEVTQEVTKLSFSDALVAKFTALEAKIVELEEKLSKFEEKEELTIDETPIVIQNSNVVHTDVITDVVDTNKNQEIEKFSAKTRNDLIGLRG